MHVIFQVDIEIDIEDIENVQHRHEIIKINVIYLCIYLQSGHHGEISHICLVPSCCHTWFCPQSQKQSCPRLQLNRFVHPEHKGLPRSPLKYIFKIKTLLRKVLLNL